MPRIFFLGNNGSEWEEILVLFGCSSSKGFLTEVGMKAFCYGLALGPAVVELAPVGNGKGCGCPAVSSLKSENLAGLCGHDVPKLGQFPRCRNLILSSSLELMQFQRVASLTRLPREVGI